jgi:hypothetical protein
MMEKQMKMNGKEGGCGVNQNGCIVLHHKNGKSKYLEAISERDDKEEEEDEDDEEDEEARADEDREEANEDNDEDEDKDEDDDDEDEDDDEDADDNDGMEEIREDDDETAAKGGCCMTDDNEDNDEEDDADEETCDEDCVGTASGTACATPSKPGSKSIFTTTERNKPFKAGAVLGDCTMIGELMSGCAAEDVGTEEATACEGCNEMAGCAACAMMMSSEPNGSKDEDPRKQKNHAPKIKIK